MTLNITLEMRHPDRSSGDVEGFRYLWAFYVNGYRSDKHCQPCFKGRVVPGFNKSTGLTGEPIVLDRTAKSRFVYVCGVASGPTKELYRKNFHLPLRFEEGASVSAVTYNGYVLTARNAVLLQIPALPKDWRPVEGGLALPDGMTRCKNFQFAVEYFGYPSPHHPRVLASAPAMPGMCD